VDRECNSSPLLGLNQVKNLDEKIYVDIHVVYASETILKDNKFFSRRNTQNNEDPSLYLYLHTWEPLYYGVSAYSNMYLRTSRELGDDKTNKDPKGTESDLSIYECTYFN
jgi:hypothetical protein